MLATAIADPKDVAPEDAPAVSRAGGALAGLSLVMLLASLGTSIANVSLPTLMGAFGASFQAAQWVVLAYLVAITAVIVGAGRLGDLLGPRRILLGGIAVFTGASAIAGLAPSLGLLIAARGLQGLAAAVMMALSMAFVTGIWPKAKTGRAMGLLGTMSAVGTAIGPSLGGGLIGLAGWRAIFLMQVPLGLLAGLLAGRYLPADRRKGRETARGFDGIGTLLLAVALAAYAIAMTTGKGRFGATNLALLAGAALAAGGFLWAETRVSSPLVDLQWLRDAVLRTRLLTSGIVSTVMMTTLVVGPFYLTLTLGMEAAAVGLVLSIGPTMAALTGVPAGRWVERVGARVATRVGLAGIGAGSFLLALLPASTGLAGYVGPIALLTVSYALFQTANNTAVMRDLPAGRRGVIAGLLNLSRNLGLVTGASVMTALFAAASGKPVTGAADPGAVAAGMHVTFAVAGALATGALALAWREADREG